MIPYETISGRVEAIRETIHRLVHQPHGIDPVQILTIMNHSLDLIELLMVKTQELEDVLY